VKPSEWARGYRNEEFWTLRKTLPESRLI